MGHTPGPWKVEKFSGQDPLDDDYAISYTHPNGYSQTIARLILDHPESVDGVAANAALIAAAPDMLAVLERLYLLLADGEEYVPLELREEAEATIRKARGEV